MNIDGLPVLVPIAEVGAASELDWLGFASPRQSSQALAFHTNLHPIQPTHSYHGTPYHYHCAALYVWVVDRGPLSLFCLSPPSGRARFILHTSSLYSFPLSPPRCDPLQSYAILSHLALLSLPRPILDRTNCITHLFNPSFRSESSIAIFTETQHFGSRFRALQTTAIPPPFLCSLVRPAPIPLRLDTCTKFHCIAGYNQD